MIYLFYYIEFFRYCWIVVFTLNMEHFLTLYWLLILSCHWYVCGQICTTLPFSSNGIRVDLIPTRGIRPSCDQLGTRFVQGTCKGRHIVARLLMDEAMVSLTDCMTLRGQEELKCHVEVDVDSLIVDRRLKS